MWASIPFTPILRRERFSQLPSCLAFYFPSCISFLPFLSPFPSFPFLSPVLPLHLSLSLPPNTQSKTIMSQLVV